MNSFGRTAAAVIVAAGLFGYIYFVESKKDPKSGETGTAKREKVFTGFDKLKVRSLTLKKRNGDLVHAEKNGEAWTLVSPQEVAADPGEISTILDSLQNLESEETVNEGATDLAPFGLTEPKVSVQAVAEGASKPFEFDLGDSVPAGSSIFARVPGKPRLFTVSSTIENTLSKSAFDLRDRGVVKVKKDAIRAFEVFEKNKSAYRLARGAEGEDDWKVVSPVSSRAARWSADSLLGLIENLRMDSIASEDAKPAELAKYGLGPSARRVVLTLEGDKTVSLEVGKKAEGSKYYAREGASKLVAVIPAAVVDDLDKGLKNLRATRLLDVATYEVASLDVTTGAATKSFKKSTTKAKDGLDETRWTATPPVKEAADEAVSAAMIAIGGAEVVEFIDAPKALSGYGLDAPAVKVTLHSGKRSDWFELAIKGDAAFARRNDDASVLKLDKTKAEGLIKAFGALGS